MNPQTNQIHREDQGGRHNPMDNHSRRSWQQQLRTVVPMAVMILILAACGSSEDDASTGTTSPPPAPTTTTAAASATTSAPATTATPVTSASTGDAIATYDGSECVYEGPTEFDLNTTVTFTVTNESDTTDMGFSVWSVPEGTTADEILEDGIFTVVGGGPPADPEKGFHTALFAPTAIGTSEGLRVFLDTPGLHAFNCFDSSTGGGNHAIMFTVNG